MSSIASAAARPWPHAKLDAAIDLLVYYAGWADKYQQVFSSVNPVASSHFNFSLLEPTGVVAIVAPEDPPLLGLVANLAPAMAGGNCSIALASEARPLPAVSFAEVLHSSDVPAGVVNILTGKVSELAEHMATHMDVNALVFARDDAKVIAQIQQQAAGNIKRVILRGQPGSGDPYQICDTQEVKTTWHPIGR